MVVKMQKSGSKSGRRLLNGVGRSTETQIIVKITLVV